MSPLARCTLTTAARLTWIGSRAAGWAGLTSAVGEDAAGGGFGGVAAAAGLSPVGGWGPAPAGVSDGLILSFSSVTDTSCPL
jgi:hypothetical protein